MDELTARPIVVKNISREADGAGGGIDGCKHGGKGGVAVNERFHGVASGQGAANDAIHGFGQMLQMGGFRGQ